MRQKPKSMPVSSEGVVRDIRRATRKHHAAEEKIRIVLDGLRGETSIAELCRREGIAQSKLGEGINDERIKFDRTTLATLISRIEVQGNQLVISQKPTNDTIEPEVLSIPWQKPPSKRARKILLPNGTPRDNLRPERAERRARLVSAIARGRRWLDEVVSGSVTDAGQLAKRERCTLRQVNLTLSLAFLAPQLVKAAVEGRLPRGINIERLRDRDPEWATQFKDLGLNPINSEQPAAT